MLLLRNVNCVSIVQLLLFFNVFSLLLLVKFTFLMSTKNAKNATKAHKKYYLRCLF